MAKTNKIMSIPELVEKAYKQVGIVQKSNEEQLKDVVKKLQ